MKKVSYSLRIGIVGNIETIKETFFESLSKSAIKSNLTDRKYEFLLVFNQVPIKFRFFLKKNFDDLLYDYENIQNLDVLILTLNLYQPDSLELIKKQKLEEFVETFSFQGISILVGMDIPHISNKPPPNKFKISRFQLEKTTKDLNFIYCFEILNKSKDINEIYYVILNDYILRFQFSNPELFEQAKDYGKKLIN
ncbi:MAG: hypothetical protein ACFE9I_00105 [Candidatus Hermodarchaeota archaeon]